MEILRTPPPPKRRKERRLTDEIRALRPGESFKTDPRTAKAAVNHFRYIGLDARQERQPDGQIQVWVVERE